MRFQFDWGKQMSVYAHVLGGGGEKLEFKQALDNSCHNIWENLSKYMERKQIRPAELHY